MYSQQPVSIGVATANAGAVNLTESSGPWLKPNDSSRLRWGLVKVTAGNRIAYLNMLWGAFAFAAMGAFSHAAGERCSWQLVSVGRTMVMFLIAAALARAAGVKIVFLGGPMLWIRSVAGSIGSVCGLYAVTHLPVSTALTLYNTTPIWITLLSRLFFGQRTSAATWLAALLSVGGIALIQQPNFGSEGMAGLVALAGALFVSMARLSLNRLRDLDPRAVVTHFSAVSCIATLILLLLTGGGTLLAQLDNAHTLALLAQSNNAHTLALLALAGVSGVIAQWGMTLAYARGHAARIAVVEISQILFALMFDLLIWHRTVNTVSVMGMLLVVAPMAWLLKGDR